jgi:glycerol kinase
MVVNETLMQFQADILGFPVIHLQGRRDHLCAAYAGLATGFWAEVEDLREKWGGGQALGTADGRRRPRRGLPLLEKAVERTFECPQRSTEAGPCRLVPPGPKSFSART